MLTLLLKGVKKFYFYFLRFFLFAIGINNTSGAP
jgi:hypothetical protein